MKVVCKKENKVFALHGISDFFITDPVYNVVHPYCGTVGYPKEVFDEIFEIIPEKITKMDVQSAKTTVYGMAKKIPKADMELNENAVDEATKKLKLDLLEYLMDEKRIDTVPFTTYSDIGKDGFTIVSVQIYISK